MTIFWRWLFMRGAFNRGYVLPSGLYFVVGAHLSASQNVLLGTAMSTTLVLTDIPTGVWADSLGRKRPFVIGQLLLGASMVLTELVTAFPLLVVTQVFTPSRGQCHVCQCYLRQWCTDGDLADQPTDSTCTTDA